MQTSQEYFTTIAYAKFGGQTECIMDNWKIVNMRPVFMIFTNGIRTFTGTGFLSCYRSIESYVEVHHDRIAQMAHCLP